MKKTLTYEARILIVIVLFGVLTMGIVTNQNKMNERFELNRERVETLLQDLNEIEAGLQVIREAQDAYAAELGITLGE